MTTTTVGCGGECPRVRNPDVIDAAARVQLIGELLAFHDSEGHVTGLHRGT